MIVLSADVGGTFTDLVLAIGSTGQSWADKVLSTPASPDAVLAGILRLTMRASIKPAEIDVFVHGFTIATNAWLTRSGSRTVLGVTDGFQDVLEIGDQRRPELYSLTQSRSVPLVPRSLVVGINERISADGEVVNRLSPQEVLRSVEAIAALAPEAVAISLLFSHLDDRHERVLGDALRKRLPKVPVYLSCDINPQIEEFPRTTTTVVAAYVGPVVDAYVARLESALPRIGVRAPVLLMRSDGGISTIQAVRENPATVLLSGPAGGVTAGLEAGARLGVGDVVTFDMGGTSADFALISNGRPSVANARTMMGEVLRVASLDIHTISAGGGSVGWVDIGGALRVGPHSAGSTPGPACYGTGGERPTLTDAALVLGYIAADQYLGGEMMLDRAAACNAIQTHVAGLLGVSVENAAFGMLAIANVHMAQAIRQVSVERGHDVRRFALMSFGGAGSVFAPFLVRDLGMREVLVPARPGVFSALGLIQSDFRYTKQRAMQTPLDAIDPEELVGPFQAMHCATTQDLARDGIALADQSFRALLDIRYIGQMHELTIEVPGPLMEGWWDAGAIYEAFRARHELEFGFADAGVPAEIVNLRLDAVGRVHRPDLHGKDPVQSNASRDFEPRSIYLGPKEGAVTARVMRRVDIRPSDVINGPLIINQADTTTLVLPRQQVSVARDGVLVIRDVGEVK